MSEGQQRIENILKKYLDDKKEKFIHFEEENNEILDKLRFLRGAVFNHIKSQCPNPTKWLEKHGEINFDDKGINIKIFENIGNNADAFIQEFDICAQSNDFGLKSFFDEANSKKSLILSNNQACLSKCVYLEKDKTDQDIYNCFSDCFDFSFLESDGIFRNIDKKIQDLRFSLKI